MVGVTEAVGEEEAIDGREDSWEEAEPMAIKEAEEAPSDADMSLFISSLLLRDTGQEHKYIMSCDYSYNNTL